jgi:hypothetical protein
MLELHNGEYSYVATKAIIFGEEYDLPLDKESIGYIVLNQFLKEMKQKK